jgi:hypothetical protein
VAVLGRKGGLPWQGFSAAETFLEGLRGCFKGDREEVPSSPSPYQTIGNPALGQPGSVRKWKHVVQALRVWAAKDIKSRLQRLLEILSHCMRQAGDAGHSPLGRRAC